MAQLPSTGSGPNTFPAGLVHRRREQASWTRAPWPCASLARIWRCTAGESGKPVMLDAYCAHMGTHLTASTSAMIVKNGLQIEGDSIRCPYHGWRYNAQGDVDDIPYFDGPCPKSASIRSYPVVDNMGCVMAWYDPDGRAPDYDPPFLPQWDDPQWVNWKLDHLGELTIHPQEILDNMADVRHLGPTHGAPSEYFENEFRDHIIIQRQGGPMQLYQTYLYTTTWYTGPGILLSKQVFGGNVIFELIANTPVDDGVVKCWHGILYRGSEGGATDADRAAAKAGPGRRTGGFRRRLQCLEVQAAGHQDHAAEDRWPIPPRAQVVLAVLPDPGSCRAIQAELNGIHHTEHMATPAEAKHNIDQGLPF